MTSSTEDTPERLIAAATALFAAHGFDGTSVKGVADAAGVNVSLVSYHFGGKEGLYAACLQKFGEDRLAMTQRVLHAPRSQEELVVRLRMFIEELFDFHVADTTRAQMLHRDCEMNVPAAEGVFRNTFMKIFETYVAFITHAQKVGLVDASLDPMITTSCIFGSTVHFLRSDVMAEKFFGLSLKNEAHRKNVIDHLIRIGIGGMQRPEAATPDQNPQHKQKKNRSSEPL
jgi:AcrR family transcriptional regulator